MPRPARSLSFAGLTVRLDVEARKSEQPCVECVVPSHQFNRASEVHAFAAQSPERLEISVTVRDYIDGNFTYLRPLNPLLGYAVEQNFGAGVVHDNFWW